MRSEGIFGCSIAAGIVLRLYQIRKQIPADDEWHGLTASLYSGYASILSHFGSADRSIPLTVFYELLADTVGLSEMGMRFLPLLFGIAALVVVPVMLELVVGRGPARIAGALLALSPLHVYFSRYARPYSITMLISVLGVLAFYRWWTENKTVWGVLYAACAITGPHFHLVVTPVLLSPLLFALAWRILSGKSQVRIMQIVAVGAAVATGLCLLLAAPVTRDLYALRGKVAQSRLTWNSLNGAWHLLAGSSSDIFVLAAAGICLAGLIILFQRNYRLAAFLMFLALCQILFLLLTTPDGIHIPIVLARYLLALLPILLLLAAIALDRAELVFSKLRYYPRGALVAGILLLQFFAGPLRSIYYFPNNWTNHAAFQYYYLPEGNNPYEHILRTKTIPPFYRYLSSSRPGSISVVEAPWYYEWQNVLYPYYQQVHRQWMYIGFVDQEPFSARTGEVPRAIPRFWFRNYVHVGDLAGLKYRKVNYVIFHKDLAHEIPNGASRPPVDVSPWVEYYRREFGAPAFEDSLMVVFDVSRPQHIQVSPNVP